MVSVVSFIWLFILAHLIGDFVLQTNKVAKMKAESQKGLILHFCLITGAQMLILGIYYGSLGLVAAIVIGLIHWLIDYVKIKHTSDFKYQSIYFLLDQAMHIITIILIAWLLDPGESKYEIVMPILTLGVAVVIAVYVLSILVQFIVTDFISNTHRETFFQPYERAIDAVAALLVLFLISNGQLYTMVIVVLLGLIFGLLEHKVYKYKVPVIASKYLVFVVFGLATALMF